MSLRRSAFQCSLTSARMSSYLAREKISRVPYSLSQMEATSPYEVELRSMSHFMPSQHLSLKSHDFPRTAEFSGLKVCFLCQSQSYGMLFTFLLVFCMSKRVRFLSFLSLFLSFSLSFKLSVDLLRFILLLAGSNVIVVNDSE